MTARASWCGSRWASTRRSQLAGASICVQTGTTTELNLADYFKANNMTYNPVVFEKLDEVEAAYDCRPLRRLHHRRFGPLRRSA